MLTPVRCRWITLVVLTVAWFAAVNGQAVSLWLGHNAAEAEHDAWTTGYGLALRSATADDATIAVTWAGAIPYFSDRQAIDLLGKSDRVIAMRIPQSTVGFTPGHDKWDYAYSIGQLRPDVVAGLWHANQIDARAIAGWGYLPLAPWVFVRADSTKVNRAAVREAACMVLRGTRSSSTVWGGTRSTATIPELDTVAEEPHARPPWQRSRFRTAPVSAVGFCWPIYRHRPLHLDVQVVKSPQFDYVLPWCDSPPRPLGLIGGLNWSTQRFSKRL